MSEALEGFSRSPRSIESANGPTKCGGYLLRFSLAAALLDSLFEYPASLFSHCATCKDHRNPYWSQ